jgi:poly(3-hydroxybutyrate) depolymerase
MIRFILFTLSCLILFSCKKEKQESVVTDAYRVTKKISYNNIEVDVVIDKPALRDLDVLLVFHGTVQSDTNIINAANTTLDKFKEILDRQDMMLISVAHPQKNILFGDNILQAEAALLWLKTKANQELGINVKKIFLGGHSQGGYLVTRLNTMHPTNGVIANAPGPLNLVFRCQLEENGQAPPSYVCDTLRSYYGTTAVNPSAYFQRSLLNFTSDFKSDILFVQGLNDAPIQLYSWPAFKQAVSNCANCQNIEFVEIQGGDHGSLFNNTDAKIAFNQFINSR